MIAHVQLAPADEHFEARVKLLHRRGIANVLITAAGCTVLVAYLYARMHKPDLLQGLVVMLLLQMLRLYDMVRYLRPQQREGLPPQSALVRYTIGVALTIGLWHRYAFALLPELETAPHLVALCMFSALLVSNSLTLAAFRPLAIAASVAFALPSAILQMLLPDEWGLPLGLLGVICIALSLMLIETAHRAEMRTLFGDPTSDRSIAFPEHAPSLAAGQVRVLYQRAVLGTCIAIMLAFAMVAEVLSRNNDPQLWYWLLAMGSVQTLRAADIMAYQRSGGSGISNRVWKLRFGLGLAGAILTWHAFLWLFFPGLDLFSRIFTLAILYVLSVGSVLTLAVSRVLAIGYMFATLLPVLLFWLHEAGDAGVGLELLVMLLIGLVLVMTESTHRITREALHVQHLKSLAEQREQEARQLNAELSQARSRLVEANANLEQKVAQRTTELEQIANRDPLTGLHNRHRFAALVGSAIKTCAAAQQGFAICFVDLDRFKEINDGLGHPIGDRVLCAVAQRLRAICGDAVACARWGGDEFVLLYSGPCAVEDVQQFADGLRHSLAQPVDTGRTAMAIGASIGISLYPQHGANAADLIEHADIAVYRAKQLGRGRVCMYQPDWGVEARRRLDMAQALRRAVETETLVLHYQPVVSVPDGRLYGFEALLRWPSADLGLVPPDVFVPLAEDSGLMPQLGNMVLRQACDTAQRLYPQPSGPVVAVNISVSQIMSDGFVEQVRDVLTRSRLAPRRLELEVTETLFAGNLDRVKTTLQQLRELGVRISIDDFGTGYSSMNYLRSLPLDTLKIDGAFVHDLNRGGEAIFSTLIHLAESLRLDVIVEGVETAFELQRVLALGANRVQGYHFAQPMPAEDLANWTPRRPPAALRSA